jgi:N-acetylmuramic acid 6-phosphate etherase
MTTSNCLIGIDGGGTKTVALLSDLEGQVIGRGVVGPSNYQVVGIETAGDAMRQAMAAAFAEAGLEPGAPRAICLGLAGVDRPADFDVIRAWLDEQMPQVTAVIVNDATIVLAAGTPEGWGIAMISGTGSIVYGRNRAGQLARAGGWGYTLGDEGSGYAIGQAALRAVMRAHDGRAPQTLLTQAVLAHWSLQAPTNLVSRVYIEQASTQDVAGLAVLVEAAASRGDAVALDILREAGRELALAAKAVVQGLVLPMPVPCAQAGSVLVKGRNVRRLFLEEAAAMGLQLDPVTPVTEPAQGAVRLAREALQG